MYFQRLPLLEGSPSHMPSAEIRGHLLAQLLQKWWEGDSKSHSNASSHRSVPAHPALFANAKSTWDVELGHGVSGLSWQHSFLLEVQLSTHLTSQKNQFWTLVGLNVANTITINFSADCMEQHAIKQSVSQMWKPGAVFSRTIKLQDSFCKLATFQFVTIGDLSPFG